MRTNGSLAVSWNRFSEISFEILELIDAGDHVIRFDGAARTGKRQRRPEGIIIGLAEQLS
jgi:hypothetical protein